MSDAPKWFIHHYGDDVQVAFQRKGSMLRNIVRKKEGFKGKSTNFWTYGTANVSQKTRLGLIPLTNPERGRVDCYTKSWYAAGMIDAEDLKMMKIDERKLLADAQAYALGRKIDDIIITDCLATTPNQMDLEFGALAYLTKDSIAVSGGTTVNSVDNVIRPGDLRTANMVGDANRPQRHFSLGLTPMKLMELAERFAFREVPEEGERYLLIGPHQWNELMRFQEFANADFVGSEDLPYKGRRGTMGKYCMGWTIFSFTGLPITSPMPGNGDRIRSCFAFTKMACGFAMNGGIETSMNFEHTRDAWFNKSKFTCGSVLIEPNGVEEIPVIENTQLRPYINQQG